MPALSQFNARNHTSWFELVVFVITSPKIPSQPITLQKEVRNEILYLSLVLSFNYTFDHNCETNLRDFHLDHSNRWTISERLVKPIGMHVFNMFSEGLKWILRRLEKEQPSHQSKEYIAGSRCAELQAHEKYLIYLSNHYFWKQVNFSQLQKAEIVFNYTSCFPHNVLLKTKG